MSMKKIVEKAEFVMNELVRIQAELKKSKELREGMTHLDWLANIPNSINGSFYICGVKAHDELYAILTMYSKMNRQYINIDPNTLIGEFKKLYEKKFIIEQANIDMQSMQRLLSKLFNISKSRLVARVCYFPCRLYNPVDDLSIEIGPVNFTPTKIFLDANKEKFDASVENTVNDKIKHLKELKEKGFNTKIVYDDERKAAGDSLEYVLSLLNEKHWIASSSVAPCSKTIARRVSKENVISAIDSLNLIFSANFTQSFEVGTPPAVNEAPLIEEVNGYFTYGWAREFMGKKQPEKLNNILSEKYPARIIKQMSSLLTRKSNLEKLDAVSSRLLHCLRHFSNARNDNDSAIKVFRLVLAMEGLLLPVKKDDEIKNEFVQRGAIFFSDEEKEKAIKNLKKAYDARSSVAHGNIDSENITKCVSIKNLDYAVRSVLSYVLDLITHLSEANSTLTIDMLENHWVDLLHMSNNKMLFSSPNPSH